jgi:hypothetical protein
MISRPIRSRASETILSVESILTHGTRNGRIQCRGARARADQAVEGARIEQRGPSSERGEFVAVSAVDSFD